MMMNKRNNIYVDIHVLQTVPPSCVNRDDTGSPKTAIYGGVRRARVSSQAWKHAMRIAFREMYAPEELAYRTKKMAILLKNEIMRLAPESDEKKAEQLAVEALKCVGLSFKSKSADNDLSALFFVNTRQLQALAEYALNNPDHLEKKSKKKASNAVEGDENNKEKDKRDVEFEKSQAKCREMLYKEPSFEQVLFGRMVAADHLMNYDATAQVAHAISTHAVQNEFDYFTAVDDIAQEDISGAAHLDTTEFNSSTLYRYATINVQELAKWPDFDVPLIVSNFIRAFIYSMPTGKQNSFANRTPADAVYVTLRNDQPINLVGAFERPVSAAELCGYVAESESRLVEYAQKVYRSFAPDPISAYGMGEAMQPIAKVMGPGELFDSIEQDISRLLKKGDA